MLSGKQVLAIIPARAGSVGVKGKNYREVLGRPLVQWSMLAALASQYVDAVIVTSNCIHVKEITEKVQSAIMRFTSHKKNVLSLVQDKEKSKLFDSAFRDSCTALADLGCVPYCEKLYYVQRPEEICGPQASTESAMIHAYEIAKSNYDIDADIIVLLQPTSPVRKGKLVSRCLEQFEKVKADSLFTANGMTPFFWRIENGRTIPLYDYKNRPMRQNVRDDEILWHDNGNIYITARDVLVREQCRLGGKIEIFPTDEFESVQIDTENELTMVEKIGQTWGSLVL